MSKQTKLREILTEAVVGENWVSVNENGKKIIDKAEQAIKALLLSKLPEKKYVSEDEDPAKAYDDLVHQGYNQAIEEITKIIKEI